MLHLTALHAVTRPLAIAALAAAGIAGPGLAAAHAVPAAPAAIMHAEVCSASAGAATSPRSAMHAGMPAVCESASNGVVMRMPGRGGR